MMIICKGWKKVMDGHGIKLHRYLRLSEVVYCL